MKHFTHIALFALSIIASALPGTGCSLQQARETMKDRKLMIAPVMPGGTPRPMIVNTPDGETERYETQPFDGDAFMIMFRGRL